MMRGLAAVHHGDMSGSLAPHVDVGLTVAQVHGDHRLHLVAPLGARSLCHRPVRVRPLRTTFAESGCADCLRAAVAAGHLAALEGDRTWVDLRGMQPLLD
jgi:hypothetical protein